MVARRLILTADESTWPQDNKEPVLFLGEWCRRYSRKEVWQQLNAEISPYHWDDRQKLFNDYQYLQDLYEKLLSNLSNELNRIHSVNHSPRYWRILIGPWLGYFIHVLFDRWFMLKETIKKKEIFECNIIERDPMSIVSNDMGHFTKLYDDDDSNEAIYGQLLELCWSDKINIKKISVSPIDKKKKDNVDQTANSTFFKKNFKKWIALFNKLFPKDDGYFFIASYLPFKIDLKLQMSLGQFPKIWQNQSAPETNPNIQQRQWWLVDHKLKDASFEDIARQLIPLHIPTVYLEGYKKLVKTEGLLDWPKKPKIIFTSNAWFGDDVFKRWMAEKIESGTMLMVGQHGGHFGMTPFSFMEKHQIDIADKWLSWGWSDKIRSQIIPIGNFKNLRQRTGYNPNGRALMVETGLPRYSCYLTATPISSQFLDYLDDQQKFLKFLPRKICSQVLVRLYAKDFGWDQRERWKNKMPEVKIDSRNQNILKLIRKSRLCISTSNSTTYLESLKLNVPTIIFWNPKNWELKEKTKTYFELLKSVGIFHETPESAAQQIINVWDDIASWWDSKEVQNARQKFCEEYSRDIEGSIEKLKKVFIIN